MTSLYENLPTLEAAAQEIGPTVERLLRHGEASERAASSLLERIEAQRPEVDALAEEVERALDRLAEESASTQAEVDAAEQRAGDGVDALQRELQDTEQELAAETETAGQALGSLGERMRSAGEEAEGGEDRAAAAGESLDDGLSESARELTAAVDRAVAAGEGLQEAVGEARGSLATASEALAERLRSALDRGRERVASSIAYLEGESREHDVTIVQKRGEVEADAQVMADDKGDVMGSACTEVEQGFDPVIEELTGLAERMTEHEEMVDAELEALLSLYGCLNERVGPLQSGVDAVKTAASQVGLNWP